MRNYKALNKQIYKDGDFSIIPIRDEDKYDIMCWRNEQIYHLRQKEPLTKEMQEQYFEKTVSQLFEVSEPNQILFSFLKDGRCIGYGGLVHMNWIDKNAEISFIMNTEYEKEKFHTYWSHYLTLIKEVAFQDLAFHKIYVYAFDLRPHLYEALESNDFFLDARLKDHCFFDNEFIDVVIYSMIKSSYENRVTS